LQKEMNDLIREVSHIEMGIVIILSTLFSHMIAHFSLHLPIKYVVSSMYSSSGTGERSLSTTLFFTTRAGDREASSQEACQAASDVVRRDLDRAGAVA
ncbi:hypothetical protein PENTCL1PPCAC_17934, partial [Pristionchus entomophagus]